MKVKILQHHIDSGTRGLHKQCAVAQAWRELFPEARMVSVAGNVLIYNEGGCDVHCFDPVDVTAHGNFIAAYDSGREVEPTEFEYVEREPNKWARYERLRDSDDLPF